jgi:hypothetical protein
MIDVNVLFEIVLVNEQLYVSSCRFSPVSPHVHARGEAAGTFTEKRQF